MNRLLQSVRDSIIAWWPPVLIILAAALLSVELVLRLLAAPTTPPVEMAFNHASRNCMRPVPASARTYHRSGLLDRGVVQRINRLGLRGSIPRPNADVKVAILGGDAVYGVGVAERDTLSSRLNSIFADRNPGHRVVFFNLGFPGFNIDEQVRELQRLDPVFSPDIVVVMLDRESFLPPLCARSALPVRNFLHRKVAIIGLLEDHMAATSMYPGRNFIIPRTAPELGFLIDGFTGATDAGLVFLGLSGMGNVEPPGPEPVSIGTVFAKRGLRYSELNDGASCSGRQVPPVTGDADIRPEILDFVAAETACRIDDLVDGVIEAKNRH